MANQTRNVDIDYIQKDFQSTVDALVSFANVQFGPGTEAGRLWTSFNQSSFSRTWLELISYVADVFFFYLDSQATQTYLQTATVRSAVIDIAKQFGFTPASATSASGVASFTTTGPGTIPRGFRVSAANGAEFFVTNNITVTGAGTFNGTVLQGKITTEQFPAEGLQNEEFDLIGPNIIRDLDNLNTQDRTPQVTIGGNSYTLVDSFIRFNGTDTPAIIDSLGNVIGGGGRVFILDERPDGTPFIRFGDGLFGRKILPGEVVNITYRTGGGTAGNIPIETLNNLVDSLPFVSSVINNAEFSGGADEQSIEQLRDLIPASLRTLERAVAEQDYSDILIANFNEVFTASTEQNNTDPGIDLNVYVVPQGTGIPKISDNILLRNRLTNFLDRRKMVTVQFQITDAFGIDILIGLEVFITDTTSKTNTTRSIVSALTNFFSLSTGGPDESGIGFAEPILLKDIHNVIEEIPGIERFEIKKLTYRPRIDERVIGLLTEYNSSEVTIFSNVEELEWLLAAGGPELEASGTLLFENTALTGFTYSSSTGLITYNFPVDLDGIAPGDQFREGGASPDDFTILAVDTVNSTVTIAEGQTVDTTIIDSNSGSIRNGSTSFESYRVFKKLRATATNLSIDSITDSNLDVSVLTGNGTALSARVLLDNENIFVPNQFSTGEFFLVDSSGNIWDIIFNDSNTLKTSVNAINDASVTSLTSGEYKIVKNFSGSQVVFQGNIFNIQFNSENTFFSTSAQFSQIGTIGDDFAVSTLQSNIGNLGISADLVSHNSTTGAIRLNGNPQLEGISSDNVLIDSSGQRFNIVAVDNIAKPSVFYDVVNRDDEFTLEGSGLGSQVSQGFQVVETDQYAIVSLNLRRQGNIVGNLTAKVVNDDGSGLPDLLSTIATSNVKSVADIPETFTKTVFSFTTPPTLNSGTQYHLVLTPDAAYNSAEQSGVKSFDNTGTVSFTYSTLSGLIQYSSTVNLSNVSPGHFFQDSAGAQFKVLSVSDLDNQLTIATGQSVDTSAPTTSDDGAVIVFDRILLGLDSSSPTYADGEFSRFDGSSWSNSTAGPSPSSTNQDVIFSIEGTKSITVDSNLTPVLGSGATISKRYYDDENEISLILGLSAGTITFADDVNALGRGTVASVPNRPVDTLTFRTSRFADDIVNIRLNEIPQISEDDINIQILGGIE